ncbi:hypothetical protein FGO68_gene8308 [Halteria grandinella]|uniref:Uncharacterized protein n=1 Tax=Halteria grandinella TaxID=5974 RepID=A0A8J8P5I5_HALGN|nr:hypothetical protein FGO68_gene8308 [Halteria grandinella]
MPFFLLPLLSPLNFCSCSFSNLRSSSNSSMALAQSYPCISRQYLPSAWQLPSVLSFSLMCMLMSSIMSCFLCSSVCVRPAFLNTGPAEPGITSSRFMQISSPVKLLAFLIASLGTSYSRHTLSRVSFGCTWWIEQEPAGRPFMASGIYSSMEPGFLEETVFWATKPSISFCFSASFLVWISMSLWILWSGVRVAESAWCLFGVSIFVVIKHLCQFLPLAHIWLWLLIQQFATCRFGYACVQARH